MIVLLMLPDPIDSDDAEIEFDEVLEYIESRADAGADLKLIMQAFVDVLMEYAQDNGASERIH